MHQQASIPRILLVTAKGGAKSVDWGATNAKREKRKRKPEYGQLILLVIQK